MVELMVVIGIIGILIAIMIPTLLQARRPAQDRQAQNLLRNSLTAAKAIETSEGAVADAGRARHRGVGGRLRRQRDHRAGRATAGLGRHDQTVGGVDYLDPRVVRVRPAAASPSSSRPRARHSSSASTAPRRVGPPSSTPRPAGRAPGRDGPGSPPSRAPLRSLPSSCLTRSCSSSAASSASSSAPSSTSSSGGCPATSRSSGRARTARAATPSSARSRTSRCSRGSCSGAGAGTAAPGSRPATRWWSSLTAGALGRAGPALRRHLGAPAVPRARRRAGGAVAHRPRPLPAARTGSCTRPGS